MQKYWREILKPRDHTMFHALITWPKSYSPQSQSLLRLVEMLLIYSELWISQHVPWGERENAI